LFSKHLNVKGPRPSLKLEGGRRANRQTGASVCQRRPKASSVGGDPESHRHAARGDGFSKERGVGRPVKGKKKKLGRKKQIWMRGEEDCKGRFSARPDSRILKSRAPYLKKEGRECHQRNEHSEIGILSARARHRHFQRTLGGLIPKS